MARPPRARTCGGSRARDGATPACGFTLTLGSGDVRDRYGRLLAYADGPHGDLGEAQLRAGLALVYRHRGRTFSRLARYRRAQAAARARRLGIWSACHKDRAPTTDR